MAVDRETDGSSRRTRRLLSASSVLLAGVAVLLLWVTPESGQARFRSHGERVAVVTSGHDPPDSGDPPRVLMVGDSGAWKSGPFLVEEAELVGFVGAYTSDINCSVVNASNTTRLSDGTVLHGDCPPGHREEAWRRAVDDFQPDVVVYYLANVGGIGEVLLDGAWVTDCDPAYDQYLEEAMLADVELLAAGGATVVLATSPDWVMASHEQVDCRNDTYRQVADRHPGTQVVDLNGFVADLAEEASGTDEPVFADVIHLSPDTSRRVARWLFQEIPELRAALPASAG